VVEGNDIDGGAASAFPILFCWGPSTGFLGGGVGVDGGHQTFLNAEAFFEEDMHEGSETVGGAGSVGNDVVFGRVVFLVVDAMTTVMSSFFAGAEMIDFLGAGGEVAFGFFAVGEKSGAFDDELDTQGLSTGAAGIFGADDLDVFAIDDEDVVFGFVGRDLREETTPLKRPWVESYLRR